MRRVHEQVFGINRGGVDPNELKPLAAPFLSTEYKAKCLGAIEMMGDLRPQPAAAEHQCSQRCWPLQSVAQYTARRGHHVSCAVFAPPLFTA